MTSTDGRSRLIGRALMASGVVRTSRGAATKRITFEFERSLGKVKPTPAFTGICYSVVKR